MKRKLHSGHQGAVPSVVASGGLAPSSSGSGIFLQGYERPQIMVNSHMCSSFGNSSVLIPGGDQSSVGLISRDTSNPVMNSMDNSGPSAGASSLVTDANSALTDGPNLQRSASFNADSYLRVPASPMSFSSTNISLSGSSAIDGSSVVQQSPHQDQCSQQVLECQQQKGASSATSLPASHTNQVSLLMGGSQIPGCRMQDLNNQSHIQKKPRLDINQQDMMQQQLLHQLLQRPNSMQLQSRNPQLEALLQQQRLRQQQQQFLQPSTHLQQVHLQQLQARQQGIQSNPSVKHPFNAGVCSRRLMQYLYHRRQRPQDNNIGYWRKFVAEYYSPRGRERLCLSSYGNVGHHALGAFPQASVDPWQCDICAAKSGRGFEASFAALPRLFQVKFGTGVIDEVIFLNLPREYRFASGILMLECEKAVQETVYEQLHVVREGKLRVIFTQDLKILSWEFCGRHYDELVPKRLVAQQVNQLLQVAQKCQGTISDSGSDGLSQQELVANGNLALTTGRQLTRSLESQAVNDLGLSKRYVRCLQIAEVVNSMKDLMDFCKEKTLGPAEGLKCFPHTTSSSKHRMQEIEKLANIQGLPMDQNTLTKLMALQNGPSNQANSSHSMVSRGTTGISAQAALALQNYQNKSTRQNSFSSYPNSVQKELSPSLVSANEIPVSFQGLVGPCGSKSNLPVSGFPSSSLPPQPQSQQLLRCTNNIRQNLQCSQGDQAVQQQMMQQLLREMPNNDKCLNPYVLPQQSGEQNRNESGFASNRPYGFQHRSLEGRKPNVLCSASNNSYGLQHQSPGGQNPNELGSTSNHSYGLQSRSLGGQNPKGSGSVGTNSCELQQQSLGQENPNGSGSACNNSLQAPRGGHNPNGSSSASNNSLQSSGGKNPNRSSSGSNQSVAVASTHDISETAGPAPLNNSLRAGSSSESTGGGSSNTLSQKAPDKPEQDELTQDDFNDFINSCLNDEAICGWKE